MSKIVNTHGWYLMLVVTWIVSWMFNYRCPLTCLHLKERGLLRSWQLGWQREYANRECSKKLRKKLQGSYDLASKVTPCHLPYSIGKKWILPNFMRLALPHRQKHRKKTKLQINYFMNIVVKILNKIWKFKESIVFPLKQPWKRANLEDSHFLVSNLLWSYNNQDNVVLA